MKRLVAAVAMVLSFSGLVLAGVGDPQVKTDHPWYPGELSCSTFDRLFKTQADLYKRVTGRDVSSDEDKALASWYWRNLNYHHCTEAVQDLWGAGFGKGGDSVMREYWNGLFGYGFGICYETHDQYNGEMAKLLGPGCSRSAGVSGHTTFEAFLKGGAYGDGQWVLLDHDISTVVFSSDGKRMLGLLEVSKDMGTLKSADHSRGWPIGGLHPSDPGAYDQVKWTGCAAGYAAAPPMLHLRAGESVKRFAQPGLEDGKTFVYWGVSLPVNGIPGPMRDRTWLDQPEKMFKTKAEAPNHPGQARYGNAVFTYTPDFAGDKYKEGVIDDAADHVTFDFFTPYVIAATPAQEVNADPKFLYANGCKNGFILKGKMTCPVEISVDEGKTWKKTDAASDGLDLTDQVKGFREYQIKFDAPAKTLAGTSLTMRTVCQTNFELIPHLKAGKNAVTFEASGTAICSAGPCKPQEDAHLIDGALDSKTNHVTLQLATPRKEPAVGIWAACRQASSDPPKDAAYNIEYSTDAGATWKSLLKDFKLNMKGLQPGDYFSQSFCQADGKLENVTGPVQVRFTNTGGRAYQLAEMQLAYKVPTTSPVKVTFAWKEGDATKTADHSYTVTAGQPDATWSIDTGANPKIQWVEYACP